MIRTSSMNASNKVTYTPEEYLSLGTGFNLHEENNYSDWLAFPQTTQNHFKLSRNLFHLFSDSSQKAAYQESNNEHSAHEYQVYNRTIRFEVIRDRFYSNPDIFISNHPEDLMTPLFKRYPTLIGEVSSKITDEFDRHFKLKKYFTNTTLKYYLLVAQYTLRVELYTRCNDENQWNYHNLTSLDDVVSIPDLNAQLSLRKIYQNTGLDKQKLPPLNQ